MVQSIGLKIETNKVVVDGKQFRKILNIQGYTFEQLIPKEVDDIPEQFLKELEYLSEAPYCYLVDDMLVVEGNDKYPHEITIGSLYPEGYFQKVLGIIKESGERLHQINERHKETKKTWVGTENFEI